MLIYFYLRIYMSPISPQLYCQMVIKNGVFRSNPQKHNNIITVNVDKIGKIKAADDISNILFL